MLSCKISLVLELVDDGKPVGPLFHLNLKPSSGIEETAWILASERLDYDRGILRRERVINFGVGPGGD